MIDSFLWMFSRSNRCARVAGWACQGRSAPRARKAARAPQGQPAPTYPQAWGSGPAIVPGWVLAWDGYQWAYTWGWVYA